MRVPFDIEPASVIETRRIDHQRIFVPMSNRESHPSGIRILGKRTAIGEDRSMNTVGAALIHNQDQSRRLDEPGQVDHMVVGKGIRQTIPARGRRLSPRSRTRLLVDSLGPRLNIAGLQVSRDVAVITARTWPSPDAGDIRLPVRSVRRGSAEIRPAVGSAGNSRRGGNRAIAREPPSTVRIQTR